MFNPSKRYFFEGYQHDLVQSKRWFCRYKHCFFNTEKGINKTIKQIEGSGVAYVNSEIYDVETRGDTIFLLNGFNLNRSKITEKVKDLFYTFDRTSGYILYNGKPIEIKNKEPHLFSWYNNQPLDFKLLTKISIGQNEIYSPKEIESITEKEEK